MTFCVMAQDIEPSCGTVEETNNDNSSKITCNGTFNDFLSNHMFDMIPTGATRVLRMRTNVIFVQNDDGEGNFTMSNSEHEDYWNSVFEEINLRLANITDETCQCTESPLYYPDIKLEFIPNFIELKDDFSWNHRNDPSPSTKNSSNKTYLNHIHNLASQHADYTQGFDAILTVDGFYYNRYVNENPDELPYWSDHVGYESLYNGHWYSAYPTNDLDHPAMWHCPDHYLRWLNGKKYSGGQWWVNKEINKAAGGFIHEYGHYFGLSHPCFNCVCPMNIMEQQYVENRLALDGC